MSFLPPDLSSKIFKWLEGSPLLAVLVWITYKGLLFLKDPARKLLQLLVDELAKKLESNIKGLGHKTLITPEEHAAQADRLIALHQYAQYACDTMNCTHVSVYGNKNGESLKNQDSIEKLIMLTEAVPLASQSAVRYMQKQREIYTADMPNLMRQIYRQAYAVVHAKDHPDPFIKNSMRQRNYQSGVAIQITSQQNDGTRLALGVVIFCWESLNISEKEPEFISSTGLNFEEVLQEFKLQFSDRMDLKPIEHAELVA